MRRRDLAIFTALATLTVFPALAPAQQGAPVWPDPPRAQQPAPAGQQEAGPGAKPAAKKPRKKPAPPQAEPPMEDDAAPAAAAAPPKPKSSAAYNVRCDGPFAKDASHDKLVKAFGAKNVTTQGSGASGGGATILFASDPKRRLEIVWHDASARARPASIVAEAQSTWRARGFRIGEPLANVEKTNGKPFKLAGFEGESGGTARDWQGGALSKLSGGCLLGMRFAADPKAPAEARNKVAGSGEFSSDSPEIRAVKPTIAELIVGYPE